MSFFAEIDSEVGQLFKEYLLRKRQKFKGWLYVSILTALRGDPESTEKGKRLGMDLFDESPFEMAERLMTEKEATAILTSDTLERRMEAWAKQHPGLPMSKAWNASIEEKKDKEYGGYMGLSSILPPSEPIADPAMDPTDPQLEIGGG